jgi:RNA polymerase sigma-70 factor, ECF subfamily
VVLSLLLNGPEAGGHGRISEMLSPDFLLPGGVAPHFPPLPSAGEQKRASPVTMTLDALLPGARSSERLGSDLVDRLQAGELSAIGEAYDLHHEHVRRFARRLVGDEDAAEDLVHETFLTLPKAIKKFEGRSALRTFLISIAVNHSRHFVRAAGRRRAAIQKAGAEPEAPGHSGSSENPEHEATRKQLAAVLTRCLDKLSVPHRVAFVLCEVEERNSREAAEILGVPEGTVRTRLMHAKKKLRTLITQEGLS